MQIAAIVLLFLVAITLVLWKPNQFACFPKELVHRADIISCNIKGDYYSEGAYGDAHRKTGCYVIQKIAQLDNDSCVCYGLANLTDRAICLGSSASEMGGGLRTCTDEFGDALEGDICEFNVFLKIYGYMHIRNETLLEACEVIENKALKSECAYRTAGLLQNDTLCEEVGAPDCRHTCYKMLVYDRGTTTIYNPKYQEDRLIAECLADLPEHYGFWLNSERYEIYFDPWNDNPKYLSMLNVTSIEALNLQNGSVITVNAFNGTYDVRVECAGYGDREEGGLGALSSLSFNGEDGNVYEIYNEDGEINIYIDPYRSSHKEFGCPEG
jgi:hypothetical protein